MLLIISGVCLIMFALVTVVKNYSETKERQSQVQRDVEVLTRPDENQVFNQWLIKYIRSRNNRVRYIDAKADFTKFVHNSFDHVMQEAIACGLIRHGIDLNDFEEYVTLGDDDEC